MAFFLGTAFTNDPDTLNTLKLSYRPGLKYTKTIILPVVLYVCETWSLKPKKETEGV
jgi:hypothetical protein